VEVEDLLREEQLVLDQHATDVAHLGHLCARHERREQERRKEVDGGQDPAQREQHVDRGVRPGLRNAVL